MRWKSNPGDFTISRMKRCTGILAIDVHIWVNGVGCGSDFFSLCVAKLTTCPLVSKIQRTVYTLLDEVDILNQLIAQSIFVLLKKIDSPLKKYLPLVIQY